MRILGREVYITAIARRTGLSPSQISRILNGTRNPSYNSLVAIAADIGVSIDDVVAWLHERESQKGDNSEPKN